MQHNRQFTGALLVFIACVGSIVVAAAAGVQQASRTSRRVVEHGVARGFPGSAELLHRSQDEFNDIRRQDRSNNNNFNGISAGILNQNYDGDNRNNINYYRRSRVNAEFSNAAQPESSDVELVPISVATTATKTVQQLHGDGNHNHDGGDSSSADAAAQVVVDKRKLLLSNLHLFNGTDTKNLTDSQKMLLIQIADRVARYGENNLFRELVNAQQQQSDKEGLVQDEGRANTKSDSTTTTVTKKARPSKRPHAATLPSLAPSKATSASTSTTKRQPLPAGDAASAAPTKTTTKSKVRPNTTGFTPSPVSASSSVTQSFASTQSLSTPAEAEKKSTTVASSRHTKKPPGSVEDIIYDYNVTASALIESLSQPNPTSNTLLYQQTMHPTANNKQSSTSELTKVRFINILLKIKID